MSQIKNFWIQHESSEKDFIEKNANTILEMPGTIGSARIVKLF